MLSEWCENGCKEPNLYSACTFPTACFQSAFTVDLQGGAIARGDEAKKLPQLKEELAAREAKRTGLKATLQRRLHALLVQAAIEARAEEGLSDDDDDEEEGQGGATDAAPPPRAAARRVRARTS